MTLFVIKCENCLKKLLQSWYSAQKSSTILNVLKLKKNTQNITHIRNISNIWFTIRSICY